MEHAVFFFRGAGAGDPACNAASTDIKSLNVLNLQIMKLAILMISLIASSFVMNAQVLSDKCPTVVVIRKSLYDSFQNAKSNKEAWERNLAKYRQVRDDLRQKYRDCAHQGDVAAFLQKAEDDVVTAETNLKTATDTFEKIEQVVRQFYDGAHDLPVVHRFYDPGYGNLGRVWTMTFNKSREGKIEIVPTYYDLPDHAVGAN